MKKIISLILFALCIVVIFCLCTIQHKSREIRKVIKQEQIQVKPIQIPTVISENQLRIIDSPVVEIKPEYLKSKTQVKKQNNKI